MKLMLTDNRLLKESINIISELVNEVNLNIDNDKIEIKALDPANVAMVDFKLLSSAFVEYDVPENLILSIKLDDLKAILRRAKPTDTIILVHDKDNSKLKVNLVGENKRVFSIALLEMDDEEQKIPQNLNFTSKVELSTVKLDEAIEDAGVVSDNVSFMSEPEKFTISAKGKINDVCVELPKTSETFVSVTEGDKVKSKYSLDYLKKMTKGSKLTDSAIVHFGNEYPLKLEYVLIDKLKLGFILAPRVDEN